VEGDKDGSERVQLSCPPLRPGSVSWWPDGSQIALMSPSNDQGKRMLTWPLPKGGRRRAFSRKVACAVRSEQTVVSLKGFHYTGTFSLWLGLDPADAPILLRDLGTEGVYALNLERK
jgi:hypothetical protein